MSRRTCRHTTSTTFKVNGQVCKVFLEPWYEHTPGYWLWNVGFAVGRSRRQLNDWYNNRLNKRRRSMANRMMGTSGMKTIVRGVKEVLRIRWKIEPGDGIVLDCTSGNPEQQFRAWLRWHKYHPEWAVDVEKKMFYWYRPPYHNDPIREDFHIIPQQPQDPEANTLGYRYFDCFLVRSKDPHSEILEIQTLVQSILDLH
jgi:hypothetical protein